MTDTRQDPATDPEVIETEPDTTSIATVGVTDASSEALALMEQRVQNQRRMFKLALGLTTPNQWTVFSGHDKDGVLKESVYPTGGASDTILRRAFGLTWGPKEINIIDGKHGPEAVCVAWLMQGDRRVEQFEGRRSMGGFVKTEADLRKGVVENMKSVAVRDLLGLRFRTPAELKDMGLDLGKIPARAEFQSHQKQGSELVAPFGRQKGDKISDLEDENLDWLITAIGESVADPSKAKWKTKNQELLDAMETEKKNRLGGDEEPPPADDGEPPWLEDEHQNGNGR